MKSPFELYNRCSIFSCDEHVVHVQDEVYPGLFFVSMFHVQARVGITPTIAELPDVRVELLVPHSRCLLEAVKALLQSTNEVISPRRREACRLRHVNVFM